MKITFESSYAAIMLDLLGITDVKPDEFAGIVNGKVFRNDIGSLIEMSDELGNSGLK